MHIRLLLMIAAIKNVLYFIDQFDRSNRHTFILLEK